MISYRNPDTNKKIDFELDEKKKIVILYGKNGVGKTTFSRLKEFDSKYVFNLDFIHKNVYVIEETGAKTSSSNKNAFSDLFIGEEVINKQKYISEITLIRKECDDLQKSSIQKMNETLGSEFKSLIISNVNSLDDAEFKFKPNTTLKHIIENYNYPKLKNSIITDDEFEKKYTQYKDKSIIGMLVGELNGSQLLKEVILGGNIKQISIISSKMQKLEEKLKFKDELIEVLKSRKIDLRRINRTWIKDGIKIHDGRTSCLLCGSADVSTQINEWKKVLTNIFVSDKNDLQKILESEIKNCDLILKRKEHFNNVVPLLIAKLTDLIFFLFNHLEKLKEDIFTTKIEFENRKVEKLTVDIGLMMKELVIYKINSNISCLYSTKKHSTNIVVEVTKIKLDIEKYLEENSVKLVNEINSIFEVMKFKKKFEIRIERRGGIKYKFTIDGSQIDTLSDGQRHKLALALFIKAINERGLEGKTIVLDDPVVALDEETYHAIKDLIIKLRIDNVTTRVIILTHNIYYTYIQLSNIFDNKKIREVTSFFRMTSNEIKELDIDILRTDDIVLFKNCLDGITSEIEILILGGITNKIFRYFLDINLRYLGISSKLIPSEEIDFLKYENTEKNELKKISSFLKKNSMLSRLPGTDIIIECFDKLRRATEIFGIKNYIEKSHIDKFLEYSTNMSYSFELHSDNIYFDFVNSANKILYTSEYEGLKNYLSHPRQQITKQITSIGNDLE